MKNDDGLTVLTKDSPYRKEKGWESEVKPIKKLSAEDTKASQKFINDGWDRE